MGMIYLLYDYEEHGPERLIATTDASKLPAMAQAWIENLVADRPYLHDLYHFDTVLAAINAALETGDTGDFALASGWGLLSLAVVDEWNPQDRRDATSIVDGSVDGDARIDAPVSSLNSEPPGRS